MTLERKPIFKKSLIGSAIIIVLGAALYSKSGKTKTEYETVSGKIDFIDNHFDNLHPRDHRFIHIEGQERLFDIFIGKETGDFSPEFEKIDDLSVGDTITVYHSDDTPLQKNKDLRLNKNVEFIDKNSQPYFIRGTKNKLGGIAFMAIGSFFVIGLIALKKSRKID